MTEKPEKDEIIAMVLALEELARNDDIGARGLRFMCKEAARMIRNLRPDIAYVE